MSVQLDRDLLKAFTFWLWVWVISPKSSISHVHSQVHGNVHILKPSMFSKAWAPWRTPHSETWESPSLSPKACHGSLVCSLWKEQHSSSVYRGKGRVTLTQQWDPSCWQTEPQSTEEAAFGSVTAVLFSEGVLASDTLAMWTQGSPCHASWWHLGRNLRFFDCKHQKRTPTHTTQQGKELIDHEVVPTNLGEDGVQGEHDNGPHRDPRSNLEWVVSSGHPLRCNALFQWRVHAVAAMADPPLLLPSCRCTSESFSVAFQRGGWVPQGPQRGHE